LKYLVCDIESGGPEVRAFFALCLFCCNRLKIFKLSTGELDIKSKPNDGNYLVRGEALGVNGIDLVQHDKEAVTESKAATLLYEFLEEHAPNGSGETYADWPRYRKKILNLSKRASDKELE